MQKIKEDVDIYKMYGIESSLLKDDFIQKYKIEKNRNFKSKSRRKY